MFLLKTYLSLPKYIYKNVYKNDIILKKLKKKKFIKLINKRSQLKNLIYKYNNLPKVIISNYILNNKFFLTLHSNFFFLFFLKKKKNFLEKCFLFDIFWYFINFKHIDLYKICFFKKLQVKFIRSVFNIKYFNLTIFNKSILNNNIILNNYFWYKYKLFFLIWKKPLKKKTKFFFLMDIYLKKNTRFRYKKKFKLRYQLNILKKKKRSKNKYIFLWFFLNSSRLLKSIKKYRFWKLWIKHSFSHYKYKLRMWPKKKRGVTWFIFLKNSFFLNTIKKCLNKYYYMKDFFFLNRNKKKKKFKFINLFFKNKLTNKFNWIFLLNCNKIKQFKKLKKIIKLIYFNFFLKINFIKLNITVTLRNNFSKKKLKYFKYTFTSLLKNSRFRKWNFLSKQYFLSFIFLFWYKSMYFLSYFLWMNIRKNLKREKKILYTCFNYLQALPLRHIGITGFKMLIKGKLFKKPRKKTFELSKGKLPLTNPSINIQFVKYFIVTRSGTFSFNLWITSIN